MPKRHTYKPWTQQERDYAIAAAKRGETCEQIGRAVGRAGDAVTQYLRQFGGWYCLAVGGRQNEPVASETAPSRSSESAGLTINEATGTADLTRTTHRPVRTLEELIAVCEIDTTVWEVETWTANTWESAAKDATGKLQARTLYQVKAKLRRVVVQPQAIAAGILDALREKVKPLRPVTYRPSTSGYLYVATFGEPHLGKRAWAPETGEDYDLQIALDRVRQSHRHLMARARALRPEKVALIVGDDLFTADNPGNTTTAGTPQEVDGRYRKVFRAGVALCREIIEGWRLIAPVSVWVKPGNHDTTITWHAGEVLAAMYAATPDIEVVNPDRLRSYYRWGTCLLGLTHGDKEKDAQLPLLMASEAKQHWAETRCRVWLTGHLHTLGRKQQRAVVHPLERDVHEEMGVTIRRCRSLSGTDAWHFNLGYVENIKAAEGFAYHRELGETDMHTGVVWPSAA